MGVKLLGTGAEEFDVSNLRIAVSRVVIKRGRERGAFPFLNFFFIVVSSIRVLERQKLLLIKAELVITLQEGKILFSFFF